MSEYMWGIDLGGTKIEAIVMSSLSIDGIILRQRIPTEAHLGYRHILQQIQALLYQVSHKVGQSPRVIGIGTPGSTDSYTGLLKNSNTICLNDQPLQKDLEALLGVPIRMANDANCFALAETKMGIVAQQYPEAELVFGVIMGTGVGGGLVINGKIRNGAHGITGEWGHNFLDASGGSCYCGKSGCIERVISGPSLEAYYLEVSGVNKKLKEIIDLAPVDLFAQQTVDRLLDMYAKAISQLINILDPDVIVLGGGLGNIDLLYTEGYQRIAQYVFNPYCHTAIVKPMLGDSAGVLGAAALSLS